MGSTDDLAIVQKMIIDTLHKEGNSKRVITERGGFSKSVVSKQHCGMTASLRILSSKADSNTWESFTRSELKLE